MRREVFVLSEPCDMRKSFDGLYGLVREINPLNSAIFFYFYRRIANGQNLCTGMVPGWSF
jgi:hypothetical protein